MAPLYKHTLTGTLQADGICANTATPPDLTFAFLFGPNKPVISSKVLSSVLSRIKDRGNITKQQYLVNNITNNLKLKPESRNQHNADSWTVLRDALRFNGLLLMRRVFTLLPLPSQETHKHLGHVDCPWGPRTNTQCALQQTRTMWSLRNAHTHVLRRPFPLSLCPVGSGASSSLSFLQRDSPASVPTRHV